MEAIYSRSGDQRDENAAYRCVSHTTQDDISLTKHEDKDKIECACKPGKNIGYITRLYDSKAAALACRCSDGDHSCGWCRIVYSDMTKYIDEISRREACSL